MGNLHEKNWDKKHRMMVDEQMIDNMVLARFAYVSQQNPNQEVLNTYSIYSFMEGCVEELLGENPIPVDVLKLVKLICSSLVKNMLKEENISYFNTENIASFFTMILKVSYVFMKKYDLGHCILKELLKFEDESERNHFEIRYHILYVPLQSLLALTDDSDDYLLSSCQIARNEVVADVENVLLENGVFEQFMKSCVLGDITALRKFMIREEGYLSTNLGEKLYDYLTLEICETREIREKMLLEIIQNFPEMALHAMEFALFSNMAIAYDKYDAMSCHLIQVLRVIADYKRYESLPFDLTTLESFMSDSFLWKDILNITFWKFDGKALNEVSDLFKNTFGVPEDEINECIVSETLSCLNLLDDDKQILSKLSNKIVYDVVEIHMPALIDMHKGMQGKYVWHKEETEGRAFYS